MNLKKNIFTNITKLEKLNANLNFLKNQLNHEKKEYVLMKLKKDKINEIKKKINSENLENAQHTLNKLRYQQYSIYNSLFPDEFREALNKQTKKNNLLLEDVYKSLENINKSSENINKEINQYGGDFGISFIAISGFLVMITLLFVKFKLIFTLFIFSLSVTKCYKNLTWNQIFTKLGKKMVVDLFLLFLVIISSGFIAPFIVFANGPLLAILNYLLDLIFKTTIDKTINIANKSIKRLNVEQTSKKIIERDMSQILKCDIKEPIVNESIKQNIKNIGYFLSKKILLNNSDSNSNSNLNNLDLSNFMFNLICIKNKIQIDNKYFYKLLINDLISNKIIGHILIDVQLANDYYSLNEEKNKINNMNLNNFIKIDKRKESKIIEFINEKSPENKDLKELFYNFYLKLITKKENKKSYFSYFSKK